MMPILHEFFGLIEATDIPPVTVGDFFVWFCKFLLAVCVVAAFLKQFFGVVRLMSGRGNLC